jgi:mono/diheme cytochrome c family protein
MLMGLTALGRAQTAVSTPGPAAARSTLDGVFTAVQALAGREEYAGRCRSCHTQAAHVLTFKAAWAGRPLSEPFQYISENMPKDSPGSLRPEETAVVLSYFLQLIGMPAGRDTLPADVEALGTIRIDTVATQSRHTSGEIP